MERHDFHPTSDATAQYNCISWALTYQAQAIWPDEDQQLGWPDSIPRNESLQSFCALFEACGFMKCEDGALEQGWAKNAILGKGGIVSHATRQLVSGLWTSKLGCGADGEHTQPDSLQSLYGGVLLFMRRAITGQPPAIPPMNPPPPRLVGMFGEPLLR